MAQQPVGNGFKAKIRVQAEGINNYKNGIYRK